VGHLEGVEGVATLVQQRLHVVVRPHGVREDEGALDYVECE
jgi:hypothetical protein